MGHVGRFTCPECGIPNEFEIQGKAPKTVHVKCSMCGCSGEGKPIGKTRIREPWDTF